LGQYNTMVTTVKQLEESPSSPHCCNSKSPSSTTPSVLFQSICMPATLIAQLAGYFPFKTDHGNLNFSYKSWPFFTFLFHSFVTPIMLAFLSLNPELNFLAIYSQSRTENFTWAFISMHLSVATFSLRLWIFLRRKSLQHFYSSMSDLLGAPTYSEYDCNLVRFLQEKVKEAKSGTRHIWVCMGTAYCTTLFFLTYFGWNIITGKQSEEHHLSQGNFQSVPYWKRLAVLVGMIYWCICQTFYFIFIFWLVGILKSVRLGLILLKNEVVDQHNKNVWILMERYSKFEELVHLFNETFQFPVTIGLLNSFLFWIIRSFSIVNYASKFGFKFSTLAICLTFYTDCINIYSICNVSSGVTQQVRIHRSYQNYEQR
jgi:hypothetical protein